MPGMMDTILNVGLNRDTVEGLAAQAGDRRFALDSYRRFIEMYAHSALDLDLGALEAVRDEVVELSGAKAVHELPEQLLEGLVVAYDRKVDDLAGEHIPADPREQLRAAIAAVFRSWNTRRARRYRQTRGINAEMGTALTVQAMVFGNLGDDSATGVAFTRCPNTGERRLFGEFLPHAQGEDVVSGRYTPLPLCDADAVAEELTLETRFPEAYAELERIGRVLEGRHREVQDLEFTVERGRLWMLQTRDAKRSARAAVRSAVEMAEEGLIDEEEALRRVDPERLSRLLHPSVDTHARRRVIAKGLPASPGAVSGVVCFDPEDTVRRAEAGERVILVRVETAAEDMEAMRASVGVLTARGGMTSHAALVARGLGRACVTGCADLIVNERAGRFTVRSQPVSVQTGQFLTIDGGTGEVILGQVATSPADPPAAFHTLMAWADGRRRVEVRVSADHAGEAEEGLKQGADGVGLCRTEHMFLEKDRRALALDLVFADGARARRELVERFLPIQREEFQALFETVGTLPIGVRLLDMPLHDLVSEDPEELRSVAERVQLPLGSVINRAHLMRAKNPELFSAEPNCQTAAMAANRKPSPSMNSTHSPLKSHG